MTLTLDSLPNITFSASFPSVAVTFTRDSFVSFNSDSIAFVLHLGHFPAICLGDPQIQQKRFVEGAVTNGHDKKKAEELFDLMAEFAKYGFNKSHSAAYAYVGYQTAYLKAHYGPEFMAANMSSEIDSTDRLVILLNECKNLNIGILPPNVNRSKTMFSVMDGKINYGLAGIKNVGVNFINELVRLRNKDGLYQSLYDLCKRLATSNQLNRNQSLNYTRYKGSCNADWQQKNVDRLL